MEVQVLLALRLGDPTVSGSKIQDLCIVKFSESMLYLQQGR